MALTKATYAMISGAPLNVLDFNADPTGSTSSQAAFDAAFAEASSVGKAVYMPSGTYLLDDISLTNGEPVGNGNKYGQSFYGDGPGKTILKCSGNSDKFLSFLGDPGNYFYTYFKASDFSIDMTSMPNAATSIGIYGIYAYGGNVTNVDVINSPASALSLYIDQGCYTTVWTNCDFGGTTGIVKLQGVGSQPVTTQTFIGCSWGQFVADNCSSNSIISCIIQGDLTPKFDLSEQYGLTITSCDMEGTGVLYNFGTNSGEITSLNNTLVGFTGSYYTGNDFSGMLLDQVWPVTTTGNPWVMRNLAITSAAAANGYSEAMAINGTIHENVSENGITRKVIDNTSGVANRVDIAFSALNGSTFVGQDATGNSYFDARGTTKVTMQQNGTDRLGVNSTGTLLFNTTIASPTGGTLAGYLACTIGGVAYKIPYYTVS